MRTRRRFASLKLKRSKDPVRKVAANFGGNKTDPFLLTATATKTNCTKIKTAMKEYFKL